MLLFSLKFLEFEFFATNSTILHNLFLENFDINYLEMCLDASFCAVRCHNHIFYHEFDHSGYGHMVGMLPSRPNIATEGWVHLQFRMIKYKKEVQIANGKILSTQHDDSEPETT